MPLNKPVCVDSLREALGRSQVCHLSDQEAVDLAAATIQSWRLKALEARVELREVTKPVDPRQAVAS